MSLADYELLVESDMVPNRTRSTGFPWALENQEPAQFEERHLIFLKQLGKVRHKHVQMTSCCYSTCSEFFRIVMSVWLLLHNLGRMCTITKLDIRCHNLIT